MTHDILKILDTTDLEELDKQRITSDLLRLFNIVGRKKVLRDYFAWHEGKTHTPSDIDEFIEQNQTSMNMMIEQNALNAIIHDIKAVREKILAQFEGLDFDFSEALDAKTELGDEDSRDDFIFENQILTCDKHGQPIAAYPIKLVDGTLILEDVYGGGRITADLRYFNVDDLLGILQAIVSLS